MVRLLLLLVAAASLSAQPADERLLLHKAENLGRLGDFARAVGTLQELYDAKSAELNWKLLSPSAELRRVLDSAEFRESELAAALKREAQALEQRRQAAAERLSREPRPPADYVAKDVCPFECCLYREWTVEQDAVLYDEPGERREVARVAEGEKVEGVTGDVHLRPTPVLVRYPPLYVEGAEVGDIVFLLDYMGEGYGRIWHEGRVLETEIFSVAEQCLFPSESCWGEYVDPHDAERQEAVWWVKIRTAAGVVGWTDKPEHFGNKDGCG